MFALETYAAVRRLDNPKLGALTPVIDTILETDRTAPVKPRHTAKRIFERLRDTAEAATRRVKDYFGTEQQLT